MANALDKFMFDGLDLGIGHVEEFIDEFNARAAEINALAATTLTADELAGIQANAPTALNPVQTLAELVIHAGLPDAHHTEDHAARHGFGGADALGTLPGGVVIGVGPETLDNHQTQHGMGGGDLITDLDVSVLNPANWVAPPTDTQNALDRLAAQVAILIAGPIP